MTTREILQSFTREERISLLGDKKTDKEVYDVLVSKGLTDSFEVFTSEAKKMFAESTSKMSKEEFLSQIDGTELTDKQLEAIAGGEYEPLFELDDRGSGLFPTHEIGVYTVACSS